MLSSRLNNIWICTVHSKIRLKPRPGGSRMKR